MMKALPWIIVTGSSRTMVTTLFSLKHHHSPPPVAIALAHDKED